MSPVVASRRLTPARVLSFLFANLVWLAPFFLAPATNASAATDTYFVQVTTDPNAGNAANCLANNAAGSGSCSLRDAITAANADGTATAIVVDMTSVSGTITLGSNLTQVFPNPTTTTIAFNGPGANLLTVSGNGAYQNFVILYSGGVTFQNFTITNGFVSKTGGCTCDPGYGGGIYAYTSVPLTLAGMVVTNNYADLGGGGILAGGSIAMTQTTVSNNSVNAAADGGIAGGLYLIGYGAITSSTIYQSTFSGNSSYLGSAIYIYGSGVPPAVLTISDSTFANNPTLTNTTNGGGSGAIINSSGATLTIHDSTFWNNVASFGAGGALNNAGTMTVTDSIIGSPGDSSGTAECYSATSACPTNGDANGNVTAPATFNLAALGSYGGPTQTVLPLPGSDAVCGGKTGAGLDADASGNPLTQDQRTLPLDATCAAGTTDAGSVQVNYLTVTTTTDSNDGSCTVSKCSLRDAITAANTANSGDIAFSNSLAGGTINLASNLPSISATGSVNVVGPSGGVTIDGGGKYQPFYIPSTSASVGLVNLTLQNSYNSTNGGGVGYGAAILDYGTLSVTNVNFLNNNAGTTTLQGEGAAILDANGSPLTVTNSYFANNVVIGPPSDGIGGAILTSGPTTISGSTFYKNSALTDGGAIYTVDGYNLTISNSTFGGNSGPVEGGAIWSSGPLTATNSTFADNTSSDGTSIFVDGANASLTNSILDAAAACDATGCPSVSDPTSGNVVGTGAAVAGTVDNNGGSVPTALPVGASLCGGNASLIPGGYTDERGNTTIDPHCTAGTMDSGAVQSDYTSVAFSAGNYDAISASPIIDPSVVVYVYEFGNNTPATSAGGVPITLDYTGTGTVNAGGTASTVAGSGATFSSLTITSTATTPQPVSAAILGSSVTAATATITFKQGTATTTTPAAAAVPFSAATQNVTLNATLTPAGINEGNVTFTVCSTATNPCTGTVIGAATVSGTVASSKASVSYALPAGLAVGAYTIDAQYIDGSSGSYATSKGTATLSVTNITIAPTTLTAITVGVPMTTQTLAASGGTGPYTYAVTTGALPAGINLSASGATAGQLTGTATQGGSISFTVTATDNLGATGTRAYTWTVNAATITLTPPAGNLAVTTHVAFSQTFTASGGTSPYTWTESGALPTGLLWNAATATISGTTSVAPGNFPITITATDHSTGTGSPYSSGAIAYTLVVSSPTITIAPTTLTAITVGVAMTTQTLTTSGGTGPYTYAVTTGTLPAGIALSTAGALTGTATQGGSISFTVTSTDANSNTGTRAYTWTVNAATLAMAPTPGNLAVSTNITFTQAFTASAGTAPYTYTESGTLPTGLTWTAGTGTISGKTTQTGSFPITITAKDSSTGTGPYTQGFAYTLVVSSPTITIAPTTLTAITVGVAMPTQTLVASGGTGPYSYAVTTGSLPAGISLNAATGALTGTATQGGSIAFTVTATDANTNTGTQAYTWTVNAPTLALAPAPGNLAVTTNITFTQAFTASAGTAPYTYTESGTLPTGLTWTAGTGTISGKATQTGSFPITITAKDSSTGAGPYSQGFNYTLVVSSPTITIAPTTLTAITVGTAVTTQTLVASGGTGPYSYTVTTGSLPAGISLNAATGALTGTATQGGSIAFTVTATDANTNTGTHAYTWTVNAPTLAMAPTPGNLAVSTNITFTQAFTASAGTAPYTYTESGTLPTGLTWTAGTGTISGKATQTGSFPITITAKDSSTGAGPYSQGFNYTLVVSSPTITIAPTTLTAITVGTAMTTQTLVASGGTGPYSYTVTTGSLPAGISLNAATGALTGTATQGGSIAFTVTATDANTNTGTQAYTWTVNAPTITLAPPAGNIAVTAEAAFTQTFTASGGTAPYTYVEAGTLPTGLSWTAGTGTIAGTATQSGSFPITITATDHSTGGGPYSSGAIAYTLVVTGPTITITPATLPSATADVAYSQQLTAAGGTGTFTWSETGALPAGVTFSTGGLLSGTPTQAGSFPITVTAKDSDNFTGTASLTLTVAGPILVVLPSSLPAATTNVAYTETFTVTGGTPAYTWSESGALPNGVSWNAATATLSGTPTVGGTFPITITVTDHTTGTGSPFSKSVGYTLAVSAPTITIAPLTLPAATVAAAYNQSVSASGGVAPYTYSVTTGTLPAGLTMSTAGAIAGTPTAGGSFGITVTAKDSNNNTGTQSYTLAVNAPTLAMTPTPGNLAVTPETAYTVTFVASGGTPSYTYTESGTLPTGLSWTAGTATISGTATQSGSFPITITAKDSSTGSGPYSQGFSYTLVVGAVTITITPATLPSATADIAYSQQLTATGGTGAITWSETGALPAGVTFSTGGLLSGTPTQAGSFPISVTAKDVDNFTGTQSYTLTVAGPVITVLPATLPAASTNVAFTQTFTASGGTSPYTWAEVGALPTGITFNPATATLSGTPTQAGTFPITITATDSTTGTGSPFSKSVGYTLAVSAPTITIGPGTLPAATIAVAYTQSVTASGGTAPYTYSVTTGALPAGLALSTAGAITGTPTAGGSFSFTITAKDSGNFTGTQSYTLTVNAPTIALAPSAGPITVTTNSAFSQTFTASGGTAPYAYTESGTLPAGLTFVNGVLSGTATASGTFPITVTAKDSSTGTGPYSSGAIAYTLNVGTTSISITWANPSPITYGTNLSAVLDATVTANGNPVPGTFVYTATPSGGSAATVTATTVLAAGSYTLTANFTPTSNAYSTPSPKTVPLTVNQAQPTITWTPATTLAYGSNLSALLNATAAFNSTSVAGSFAYTATPTGGSAVAVTSATVLAEGTYTLTATFAPSDTTDYKTATATSPLTVTGSTLTVSANNASKVYGTANPTFTGTITGQKNGDTFTESFSTTATTSSNVGTYPIVPTAAGANLSDYTVVVDDGTLTITQAASTTTLAVNSTSVNPGATVTLTATVASATTGTPTGTVSFYDGTTLLNTATLAGGVATFSTTTLAAGSSNSMTAVYSGDVNFTGSSTASPIIVTVGGLDFTLSASPASQNGLPGTTFTYQLAVAPAVAGQPYPGQVTFLVTGLPAGATATETPSTIAVGDGPKTVSLSIATSASTAAVQPLSTGRKLIPVALAFLLLPLAGTRRMRRQGRRFGQMVCLLLLALGGIVATTALSGCGTSNGFTKPGQGTPYTIAIKATSGTVTHSTTVTLTLQ